MDPESPVSRVERTLWTVWCYITEAVNRFLRPEPTNIVSNDPNSFQESTVDSEPANHAEGDASGREVDEERPLATASLLNPSRPFVAWEFCTTDIDLGPDEDSVQYKTQLSRGSESKASEEGEGTREEQLCQTGSDDAGLLVAKDAKEDEQEENGDWRLYTRERDEMPENDEYEEHVNTRVLRLTDDAMSEDLEESGSKADAEEETERAMTPDDHQKMNENMRNIQVKEEDDKMRHEDEQDLEAEDIEVKLCTIIDVSLEEVDDIEEARVQRDEADTAVTHEEVENSDGVLQLASENENKSEGARQVENQLSVCEELSDDRDFKGDPGFNSLHAELQIAYDKSGIVPEDELIVVGQEHVMAHRSASDKVEEEDEWEQGAVIEEENVNEAENNQTTDDVPEREDNIRTVTEDSQEEDILIRDVTCSEDIVQNAETELHTAHFGDDEDLAKDTEVQTITRETDDVKTESRGAVIDESSTTDISADERFFDKDQVEGERQEGEVGNRESYMEIACTATSVTVKPEGETGQEISGDFKNIPLGICEGRLVVSQELNSPTCEETQERVPEYNNESGPDENNTTHRFLKVGDYEETQTTQLPEEVESKEPESLQNSGCSAGADYLLVREHMEEDQEGTKDIKKNGFHLVVEEHAGMLRLTVAGLPQETEKPLVEPVIQESGLLYEEGKLSVDSIKTGFEQSEKDFGTEVGSTDETDKTTKELQDGTEEFLVEFEIDEWLCNSKEADAAGDGREKTGAAAVVVGFADETLTFLEAKVQKMTETNFFQESVDAINLEQNSNRTLSLLDDITESGFLKLSNETEPKLLEDRATEMQDAGIDMQETGYGVEEEAAADEIQNKNEMEMLNLQVAGMTAELTTERNEKEDALIAESELFRAVESVETKNQLSDEALEISNEEMLTDTEVADESMTTESKPKNLTKISTDEMANVTESEGSYAEGTVRSISGRQDVIDEEILDLWIQTALSEDTDGIKRRQEPEPGQQMDTEIEPSNEEQHEISSVQTEKDKEQLVESNSGESELVSDTEMSSLTVESGFLDQSLCEWGTQNNETQLLKSTSTGSFQGIYDMLANMSESADVSELSTQQLNSGSHDTLMEETAETGQSYLKEEESITETGFHPDSGVTSSEELDKSQEKTEERVESVETETGSQKEIDAEVTDLELKTAWKDTEEADVKSLTGMSALFRVEETKVEDKLLEITLCDSPDGAKHTESGRSRSGFEALSEEGKVSTESGSQSDTCTESEKKLLKLPSLDKPQPAWSEDVADSLPGLNRAEVPTTESEDQMEVDASMLDFTAQRSRIAIKNPRVRPPKDPRSLLHMPSMDPTPASHLPVKLPAGVPLGGLGIGIKLPGLGAGFPVLKKTQRVVRDENSPSQEPETKPEEKSDTPKQDEAQHKPKWMPPRHPGFGNPLMSELKTKLKKTTKE
ncbi:putative protein tag-278 [Siniperca chuatsi]|uniref:putative protein tag-278 n=1 Tax=Siniperca chuatsi TaxID=119488 RepID=UPI001CE06462|nr:putative protein tag-278 [Siniperca chuatsi]